MCSNPATMRPVPIALWLLAAFGCASGPPNTLVPGHEGAPGVQRFLVCAPNTVIALPAELQDATKALREQIDAYLEFQGREAQWIDLYDSKRLWNEAMAAAKENGALERTPVFFAKELRRALRLRRDPSCHRSWSTKTSANNGYASWDGVTRQHASRGRVRARRLRRDQLTQQIAQSGPSGDFMVHVRSRVSLRSRWGACLRGPRRSRVHSANSTCPRFQKKRAIGIRVRNDLPGGIDALREGIAIAFDPYLAAARGMRPRLFRARVWLCCGSPDAPDPPVRRALARRLADRRDERRAADRPGQRRGARRTGSTIFSASTRPSPTCSAGRSRRPAARRSR